MPDVLTRELQEQRRAALARLTAATAAGDEWLADAILYRLDELDDIAVRSGVPLPATA